MESEEPFLWENWSFSHRMLIHEEASKGGQIFRNTGLGLQEVRFTLENRRYAVPQYLAET